MRRPTLKGREGSGGPTGGPGGVERPSCRAEWGQKSPRRARRIGRLSRRVSRIRRPSRSAGRVWDALAEWREGSEAFPEGKQGLGGPPEGVERLSWKARRDWESFKEG